MTTDEAHQQELEQAYRQLAIDTAYHMWLEQRTEELEMKTSEMIQSKFLKKEDFPQPVVLSIKGVAIEEVGRNDTRWVLYFNEKTKAVVLNVTKIKQLEQRYGDDTDHWIGKKVKVSNDPTVMMGQQVVGGIKFTLPPPGTATAPIPPPPPPVDEFNDDIPF